MTFNSDACCADEFYPAFSFRGFLCRAEDPGFRTAEPVRLNQPPFAFMRMPSLCPIPQVTENAVVHCFEGVKRDIMPVIICPPSDSCIEGADHISGFLGRELTDCFPNLTHERFDIVHGWLYKQLAIVLARVLPQKVESCLLYTSPSPRDGLLSRMPSSA